MPGCSCWKMVLPRTSLPRRPTRRSCHRRKTTPWNIIQKGFPTDERAVVPEMQRTEGPLRSLLFKRTNGRDFIPAKGKKIPHQHQRSHLHTLLTHTKNIRGKARDTQASPTTASTLLMRNEPVLAMSASENCDVREIRVGLEGPNFSRKVAKKEYIWWR